jgi:outer membrane protein assembly complex protein YaeT
VVRAVSLDPGGLSVAPFRAPMAEVKLGEPLNADVVRHVVEVLVATGEVEDVVVRSAPQSDGVALVFELKPAPLLLQIRTSGDRAIDAEGIRRLLRLRDREPLWPKRLESGAQQVALELAADGYLEAQVEARAERKSGGADAMFQIHAGPRCHVGSVQIRGLEPGARQRLGTGLKPEVGKVFIRETAQKSAERLRRRIADEGFWRARVDVSETYDPATARVALVYVADPGPRVLLEWTGDEVRAASRRRIEALLHEALLHDGGAKTDVVDEAAEKLESDLKSRGFRDANVAHREQTRPAGVAIVFDVNTGAEARVGSVSVVGLDEPLALTQLETRAGRALDERLLEADSRWLARRLEDEGYTEARVEGEAPEGGGTLAVVFRSRPGARTTIGSFAIEAPQPAPDGSEKIASRLRVGDPYRTRVLAQVRNDLLATYRDAGFLTAEVRPEVSLSPGRERADIKLVVEPGPRTTIDDVIVTGLATTREEVVRRELQFSSGEPLGVQKVLESQRRLSALGIFDRVRIGEMDPESVERRSLVVSAEEAPRTTFAAGIGYGEQDLLRGSAEVTRRNLGGLDRSLSTFVRFSFRGNRVLVTYREPYLFGREREMFTTVYREEEERPDEFSYIRNGALVQTLRRLTQKWSLIVRYTYQQTHTFNVQVPLEEVDRQFRDSTFSGPSSSVVNDTRDDQLEPHAGRFLSADLQISAHALGGDSFVKSFVQASGYRRVEPWATLALSARVGLARTFGENVPALLPLPDRFFAGGDYSLRGFKQDTAGPLVLSPVTGELVPTGGNALVIAGAEMRLDAGKHLAFAVFTEAGNVYPRASDLDLGDLFYTAGAGIRYKTALGPFRVDWGYKLNPRPEESRYHVHVTIGHAF